MRTAHLRLRRNRPRPTDPRPAGSVTTPRLRRSRARLAAASRASVAQVSPLRAFATRTARPDRPGRPPHGQPAIEGTAGCQRQRRGSTARRTLRVRDGSRGRGPPRPRRATVAASGARNPGSSRINAKRSVAWPTSGRYVATSNSLESATSGTINRSRSQLAPSRPVQVLEDEQHRDRGAARASTSSAIAASRRRATCGPCGRPRQTRHRPRSRSRAGRAATATTAGPHRPRGTPRSRPQLRSLPETSWRTRRDLPMPARPSTSTTRPLPAVTSASNSWSQPSSASRPMTASINGQSTKRDQRPHQ